MSDLTTPCVPISKIDVEEGFNARTHMDEKELEGLAASLGSAGVVQPLAVRPGKKATTSPSLQGTGGSRLPSERA
ncbi:MAG: hypothetical protein QOF13_725 [Solirubrobacterales bacterium]|jgi:hypothetical protein|nr:hypothetical protein [Solirubrobacterales bacterium]